MVGEVISALEVLLANADERLLRILLDKIPGGKSSRGIRVSVESVLPLVKINSSTTTEAESDALRTSGCVPTRAFSGRDLISFSFRGKRIPLHRFKDLFLLLCAEVAKIEGENFDSILSIRPSFNRGVDRPYFSRNPNDLRVLNTNGHRYFDPDIIPGTNIYASMNISRPTIVERCQLVLGHFGINPSEVILEIAYDYNDAAAVEFLEKLILQPDPRIIPLIAGSLKTKPSEHVRIVAALQKIRVVHPPKFARLGPDTVARVVGPKDSFRGALPKRFRFQGTDHVFRKFPEVITTVCDALAAKDPKGFEEKVRSIKTISRLRESMRQPRPIGKTGLFVETQMSPEALVSLTYRIMRKAGIPESDLTVEVLVLGMGLPEKESA